jgi:hypothetical protein
MAKYAVIDNGLVVNTILSESKEIAEQCNPGFVCIEFTSENPTGIGWTYNGIDFIPPVIEELA